MRRYNFSRNKGVDFEARFDTTKIKTGGSASNQLKISFSSQSFQPCTVKWGDGSETYIDTYNSALLTKTYATEGVKTVQIVGLSFAVISDNAESNKLLSVERNGNNRFLYSSFYMCANLAYIGEDLQYFNNVVLPTSLFQDSGLQYLPANATANTTINGNGMFIRTKITSLPIGMTFPLLENGQNMFFGCSLLKTLPPEMTLSKLSNGSGMFSGCTLETARYSQLLIDMNNLNPNNNVTFHGGSSKYNSSASAARAALVARGWIITDGGLI